jgi:hypothetical protein
MGACTEKSDSQYCGGIHITERYWYSPLVFGSVLSTSVDDWVYPADYRFGGDQHGGSITWAREYTLHRSDTRLTKEQVDTHNRVGKELCGWGRK